VERSFDEHGTDLTVKRRGIAEPFGGTVPEKLIPEIIKIPGVKDVAGQLITFAATDNDDSVLAAGWSPNSFYWDNVPLKEGRLPNPDETKVALVGGDIARTLGKTVGDDITLLGETFRIVGLTDYHSIINRNQVIVKLADLQELAFRTDAVTFLSIKLDDPDDQAEADRVAEAIESLDKLSASRSESMLRNDSLFGLLTAVSTSMAWVALFMGVLMVLNTLLMAVLERTREIGILSAAGSLVGILLGIAGSKFLSAIPAIGRYVAVEPTVPLIAATALAAIVLGILGSFYPAWVATRQSPATALERA
jgi:putative ABC transport system permease protein